VILGIGIDLCRIPRIRRSVERLGEAWLEELFATEERDRCAASLDSGLAFARGFACKEACAKALGADSDDAAMSFRDHAASYSGMIPPPLGGAFQRSDVDDFSGSGQA
jgi:phosphopantetheine--protein transferase-like protein